MKPEATQDEIDDILDNADDDAQIFTQSLMQATRRGHAKAVLSEVQNRHDDIKNIEKTIVELHQLFMDMSLLVERQQETVNVVEQNAETAAVQLEEGTKLVNRAIMSAKATRTKKWCCFFLTIGICVMIGILVWWFGFDHKVNYNAYIESILGVDVYFRALVVTKWLFTRGKPVFYSCIK